jgi:hypothetical protein
MAEKGHIRSKVATKCQGTRLGDQISGGICQYVFLFRQPPISDEWKASNYQRASLDLLVDCHVLARLFAVARFLDPAKWRLGRRGIP